MPWCPNCKLEYREGFEKCSDCGSLLVEELEEEIEHDMDHDMDHDMNHEAFLIYVSSDMEADIIESKLNANGIPILRKRKGAGDYMNIVLGSTNLGVELYVPSRQLDDAKSIIGNKAEQSDISEEKSEIDDLERAYKRKRRIGAWLIILIFIPGLIWILVWAVSFIMSLITGN